MKIYMRCSEIAQIVFLVCLIVLSAMSWISAAIAVGVSGVRYPFDVSTYYLKLGIFSIIVLILQVVKMLTISRQSMNWLGWFVPILGIFTAIAQTIPYITFVKMRLNDGFIINRVDIFIIIIILGIFINSILQILLKKSF